MNENGVIDTSFIRPLATLLILQKESQFRLYGGTDGEHWNDNILIR